MKLSLKPIALILSILTTLNAQASLPTKSDTDAMLPYMTAVKNQGSRSLCTVFSFTALLESLVLKKFPQIKPKDLDLSEQWVQYVFALKSKSGGGEGAFLEDIFTQVKKHGIADEQYLPYDGTLWNAQSPQLSIERCGPLKDIMSQRRCFSSHHNPALINLDDAKLVEQGHEDFAQARASAQQNFELIGDIRSGTVSLQRAKEYLAQGIPVALKVRVYFGSWNHAAGKQYGIDIDPNQYAKGVVTYPDTNSVDRILSEKNPVAIHSVLLIGYDDTVPVTYTRLMKDGTTKEVTRTGVFYFKNSWNKQKFGKNFKLGKKKIPGFGMMVQDYAAMGQFFVMSLGE
jgi:hypothetical protein